MQGNRKPAIYRSRKDSCSLIRASCDINEQLQNHHIFNSVGLLRVEFDGKNNKASYSTAVILKTESRYPYILTAAHHVVKWNSNKQLFDKPSKICFELRTNNQSWKFWDLSRMTRKFIINPQNICVHPKYLKQAITSTECDSDIALIKCSNLLSTNKYIKPHEKSIKTVKELCHIYKSILQCRENKKMGCELLIAEEKYKRISIIGFPVEHKGQMYASNGKIKQTLTESQTMFAYNISTSIGQDGSPIFMQQIFTKMDKTNPFKNLSSIIGIHIKKNTGVKITKEKYDWIHRMLKQLGVEDEIIDKISFVEYPKQSGHYSLSFNQMFWKMDQDIILGNVLLQSTPTQKELKKIMIEQEYHFYIAELKKLSKKYNKRRNKTKSLSELQVVEEKINVYETKELDGMNEQKQKLFNLSKKYQKLKLKKTAIISNALVVVICIEQYDDGIRNVMGATMDKQRMIDLFYYKYNYDMIYNETKSCTQSEFDNIIRIAQNEFGKDENNYDCVICVFSGHGVEDELICSDQLDNGTLISKFYKAFNEINVANKMSSHKLFFIDACRDISNDVIDNLKTHKYVPDMNTIIFHPYIKGNELYSGGVLINALSKTMFDENRDYSKSVSEIETIMRSKTEYEIGEDTNGSVMINVSGKIPFKRTDNIYFNRNDIPKSQRAFRLNRPEKMYKFSNIVFK